jgi:Lectin C-type domain
MRRTPRWMSCLWSAMASFGACQAYDSDLLEANVRIGTYPTEAGGFFRDAASNSLPGPTMDRRSPPVSPEPGRAELDDEDSGILEAGAPSADDRRSPSVPTESDSGTAPAMAMDPAGRGASDAGAGTSGGGAGSAAAPPVDSARCPETTGRLWNTNGHCYFPLNVVYSWHVSRDECRELDAELASITSAEEQAFVAALVSDQPRWIGLARFGTPAFSWINGEGVVYENWEMGEPSLMGDAAALMRERTSQWFAEPVGAMHLALCERSQ